MGYSILRFTGSEIVNNCEDCVDEIEGYLAGKLDAFITVKNGGAVDEK